MILLKDVLGKKFVNFSLSWPFSPARNVYKWFNKYITRQFQFI